MRHTGIATRSWVGIFLLSFGVLLFGTGTAGAGPRILNVDFGDDNGYWLDLILREVRVTPIVAHVGDTIRFEMVLENHGDAVKTTIPISILANGKEVASRLFTFGLSNEPGKTYRETFQWDTSGVPPGEYRIRGDAFVWDDDYQFDNTLDVKEPLVLLPAGAAFPAGKENGGTAVAVN
ncbi:MAG: hypothetical protein ACWGPR_03575 [Candidatus Deferrimicrobiaceae bacterium]